MTDALPTNRRSFANAWDEIDYLYQKVLFWAYSRAQLRISRRFLPRLNRLLEREDPKATALLGLSARALAAEVDGRLTEAVDYRIREIKTLEYLLKMGGAAAYGLEAGDVSD